MKKIMLTAVMALMAGSAFANDRIEHQVESDPKYQAIAEKAAKMLEARGYQVHDVDADDHLGKPALDVEAVKNNQEYDIKLSYPDLKIIYEKRDY
ncbi:PepSY domain-containing protein [Neisseria sp. CCUG12390]|uniref:PepSY domain-containing protein n=1 Tax=Neisseria sp. CCUG12390 TaxID=3392035 RepID=UPI003A102EA5